MIVTPTPRHTAKLFTLALLGLTAAAPAAPAASLSLLHTLTGTDGSQPAPRMVSDAAGNLYGVTMGGGLNGHGTVFRLSPPAASAGSWSFTVLHAFTAADGDPTIFAGISLGPDGALYGVTQRHFYRVTLGQTAKFTNLIKISDLGYKVFYPSSSLTLGADGAFYGTSTFGDPNNAGAGFGYRAAPGAGGWSFTKIYSFGPTLGVGGAGDLLAGSDGSLVGICTCGGNGGVYRISPPASGSGDWQPTKLHVFTRNEGGLPIGGVTAGPDGVLYGMANEFKHRPLGVFYSLTPTASGYSLSFFARNTKVGYGVSQPMLRDDGSLWAAEGGFVAKATPGPDKWTFSRVTRFTDGSFVNPLIPAPGGGAYFATSFGSSAPQGRIYRLNP